jgi:hypothetical protein
MAMAEREVPFGWYWAGEFLVPAGSADVEDQIRCGLEYIRETYGGGGSA